MMPDEIPFLVQLLEGRKTKLISVTAEESVTKAITLMMLHDFSQLPVMTRSNELKGVISWKTIGRKLSQKVELLHVSEAMEHPQTIPLTATVFVLTKAIIQHDYVLVLEHNKFVKGIVTATDLSELFLELAEPFLLLEKIENRLRKLTEGVLTLEDLRAATEVKRRAQINGVQDLTFGEYQTLFQQQDNWDKLRIVACKTTFNLEMDGARQRRNEIMHFRPGSTEGDSNAPLRRFLRLLEQLGKQTS